MEPFKLKLNVKLMQSLESELSKVNLNFDSKGFLKNAKKDLDTLELKGRVRFITERLHLGFKEDEKLGLKTLLILSKKRIFSGFDLWPLLDYVSVYGLEHFDLSFKCLEVMTVDFTAEFAIRPFIKSQPQEVKKYLELWITHPNEHLRRLSSEGTRPLLPWGEKLHEINANPDLTWWILEELKNDSSLYVRKSVANHINDFSKNHSEYVLKKLKTWKNPSTETQWIIRHGLRTLLKKGHPDVLSFYGIENRGISFGKLKILTKSVKLGSSLEYEIKVQNESVTTQKVVIDSLIHLLKSNKSHNAKCFKGKTLNLLPNESRLVKIKIPLKIVTTRKYYLGVHHLNVLVNGVESKKLSFNLE